jgi:hypothetical protein
MKGRTGGQIAGLPGKIPERCRLGVVCRFAPGQGRPAGLGPALKLNYIDKENAVKRGDAVDSKNSTK